MVNLYDFFGLLKNAVRYFPDDGEPCHRPHTFLVETKDLGGNLNEPNLGATFCDKDKNYFYSRLWEQNGYPSAISFNWPLVSVFARESTIKKALSKRPQVTYQLFLNVVDVYYGGSDCPGCKCGGCQMRSVNEINADTERILLTLLSYISDSAVYRIDGVEYLYNAGHIEYLVDQGQISNPMFIRSLESKVTTLNESVLMYNTAPGENRYGTSIRINMEFDNCNTTPFEFTETDFVPVEGCTTCG